MAENTKLSTENLEIVSGGCKIVDPGGFFALRFYFSVDDVTKIRNALGIDIEPDHGYIRSELNDKGIPGYSIEKVKEYLESIGINAQYSEY